MKEDNNRSAITKKKKGDCDLLSGDTLFVHYDSPSKGEKERENDYIDK